MAGSTAFRLALVVGAVLVASATAAGVVLAGELTQEETAKAVQPRPEASRSLRAGADP